MHSMLIYFLQTPFERLFIDDFVYDAVLKVPGIANDVAKVSGWP